MLCIELQCISKKPLIKCLFAGTYLLSGDVCPSVNRQVQKAKAMVQERSHLPEPVRTFLHCSMLITHT